jgi:cytochrome c oxidase cbb3-type subunit 3
MTDLPKRHDDIQGDILHVYDGIEEADNELPRWWLATFFGAIAFGLVYWQVYQTWALAPSIEEQYATEMAARLIGGGEMTDEVLVTLSADPTTVASGHATFVTNCVVCHGDRAQGNIGPNLTDDHWIHGGSALSVYTTVREGVGTRGMPQWGPVLGDRSLQAVVAYVLTLRDTNVSGRAPEGELYVPEPAAPEAEPEPETTTTTTTTTEAATAAPSDVLAAD